MSEITHRIFHIEIQMTKWVEVKIPVTGDESDDEVEEEAQCEALMNFNDSERTWDDDYEFLTIKEVTKADPA